MYYRLSAAVLYAPTLPRARRQDNSGGQAAARLMAQAGELDLNPGTKAPRDRKTMRVRDECNIYPSLHVWI